MRTIFDGLVEELRAWHLFEQQDGNSPQRDLAEFPGLGRCPATVARRVLTTARRSRGAPEFGAPGYGAPGYGGADHDRAPRYGR